MYSEVSREDRPVNAKTEEAQPLPCLPPPPRPPQGYPVVSGRRAVFFASGTGEQMLAASPMQPFSVMDGSRLELLFQFVPNLDSRFTHNSPCQGHKSLWTTRLRD